jgi:RNA polymerase sigma factor (sigma-70 family)
VHEAYFKLVDLHTARFRDQAHFLAMASRVMRRLLIDHARARRAGRRGAGAQAVQLEDVLLIPDAQIDALTDLDDALQRLEKVDPRQSAILEQRFFGGLSLEETAEAVGVSWQPSSVSSASRAPGWRRNWVPIAFQTPCTWPRDERARWTELKNTFAAWSVCRAKNARPV